MKIKVFSKRRIVSGVLLAWGVAIFLIVLVRNHLLPMLRTAFRTEAATPAASAEKPIVRETFPKRQSSEACQTKDRLDIPAKGAIL